MSFGLSMDGLEQAITDLASEVRNQFTPVTYMEIGVAQGATLAQVARVFSAKPGWRAVGVDLPNGYSLARDQVEQNAVGQHFGVSWLQPEGWSKVDPSWNHISVILADSRDLFEGIWSHPIHFALIDGCHCRECVMRDFTNVEKFVPKDGVVMFHDYDKAINDPQPHGGHCDVVGACAELGLNDNSRLGWSAAQVMIADKSKGGANMMAVRKTV